MEVKISRNGQTYYIIIITYNNYLYLLYYYNKSYFPGPAKKGSYSGTGSSVLETVFLWLKLIKYNGKLNTSLHTKLTKKKHKTPL